VSSSSGFRVVAANRSLVRSAIGIFIVSAISTACFEGVGSTDTSSSVTAHQYTVGGTVSGLSGTGLTLQNNGEDTLAVSASGTFTFPTPLISGDSYSVVVASQPNLPTQTCVATANDGTVADGNVTTVVITCASQSNSAGSEVMDTVGGTAVGVLGSGLVLQDDGGDNLSVPANGSFTFKTPLAQGQPYAVTVLTPPINPYQDCAITGGSGTTGTNNISNVQVSCKTNSSSAFTIGGTVTGVSSAGAVVLQDNGRDNLTITADGPFTFPIAIPSGSSYSVTSASISGQQSETCAFANASGIVAASNITNVTVACQVNVPVSVTVSGLTGSGLVLQDNGTDNLAVNSNGKATFATALPSGNPYSITVATPPQNPTQNCKVANGTGVVQAGTTTNITVSCTTDSFTLGGTVAGVSGTLTLQVNGGNSFTVTANGPFTFPIALASGTAYTVTAQPQSGIPVQTCAVDNGSGIVGAANINNLAITCAINSFAVDGTISGLTGTGLVIQDNSGNNLTLPPGSTTFTFAAVASGSTYAVTVLNQPAFPTQICTVTNNGSGIVSTGNVTSVAITCVTQAYTVGGTVTGLTNAATGVTLTGLSLQDNAGTPLAITAAGFTFPGTTPSGGPYAITIDTEPSGYACAVANGSGTVTNAAITGVTVSCSPIGAFLYVTNGAGGNISGFAIDASTGTLQPLTQIAATPPAANAIIATSGTNPNSIVTGGCGASGTTNYYLYVANEGSNSISAYAPNLYRYSASPGAVTPLPTDPPRKTNPTSTVPVMAPSFLDFGQYFNGNTFDCLVLALGTYQAPGDQNASLFDTFPDGTLVADIPNPFIAGATPTAAANLYLNQEGPSSVEYIADKATGNINEFGYTPYTLAPITPPDGTPSDGAGSNPDAITIVQPSSDAPYIYVANYGTNSISQYTADPSFGYLTLISDPTTGTPAPPAITGNGPSALAQAKVTTNVNGDLVTKTYVYVANRNDGTISAFSVSPGTVNYLSGQLVSIPPTVPTTTGQLPVAMSVVTFTNPDSTTTSYLYVVNSGSNSVTAYSIAPNTGALNPLAPNSFAVGSTPTAVATAPALYSVGGTISNLTGNGLVLQNSDGSSLTVPANSTTFSFPFAPLVSGPNYNIAVQTAPTNEICIVTNGTGTVTTANVTNVSIACGSPPIQ
jgi:6-phosphogluconolactonase (cycloisomerase 2 family)